MIADILIVDDETDIRELVSGILQDARSELDARLIVVDNEDLAWGPPLRRAGRLHDLYPFNLHGGPFSTS